MIIYADFGVLEWLLEFKPRSFESIRLRNYKDHVISLVAASTAALIYEQLLSQLHNEKHYKKQFE